MKLTSRDVEILKFINEFGFCEMPQINQRFSLRKPRNYQVSNKLVRHNLLQHERIFYKQHGLFRLTGRCTFDVVTSIAPRTISQLSTRLKFIKSLPKIKNFLSWYNLDQ